MADYLTFANDSSLTIKVNGSTVSSGYELKDGDVITATIPDGMQNYIYVNNQSYTLTTANIEIYDKSIYIRRASGGAED